MSTFHKLTVHEVQPLTADACSVQFAVPEQLREDYRFHPGQHLTLRRVSGSTDERRTYSICSTPAELAEQGLLRIGVKQITGGLFSSWLNGELAAGDTVEVMTPAGRFGAGTGTAQIGRRLGCLAAGSGITPMMSIIASTLRDVPDSEVCLVYGNRTSNDVMFLEELADLKNQFPGRLNLLHVLSGEPQLSDLLTGRIDADKIGTLLAGPAADVEQWYLCGPFGMVSAARDALVAGGVAENRIHAELFFVGEQPAELPPATEHDPSERSEVTVTLAGRTSTVLVGYAGTSILDAVLASRPDAPYACKGGVCGTCRARLTTGEVSMSRNYALEPEELAAGLVLACQSHPVTPQVSLEFL
ncbi:MAG TPA: 2Fe-2S iron-sulfur cluster-binding protein [Jatrophihabitans sp.]|jgi:ring-1,2-phenylacetyl-CoA epoxidase subunit PaaE|nr:2Fe-2S iron-sulfur cluster-binding protein [Jatrophihabitans sp.]